MDKGVVITVVLTVLVFGGIIYASVDTNPAGSIEGVQEFSRTDRSHTNQPVEYERTPPVGGPHTPTWLACNSEIYTDPVDTEQAVHSLEHGAVWITHQPDVGTSTISQLEESVGRYTFMSPVPDQDSPIKLTAWGNQLSVESADDPRIGQFLSAFRQGPQTPEPGASCNAPRGAM
jgi:hypothetical protein